MDRFNWTPHSFRFAGVFAWMKRLWNESSGLALVLVLIAVGLALYSVHTVQPPGVSIGLLALAAGIMSVRPQMHPAEKLAWVVLLVLFSFLEVRAIHQSDKENDARREAQNQQFKSIVQGITALYYLSPHVIVAKGSAFSSSRMKGNCFGESRIAELQIQ